MGISRIRIVAGVVVAAVGTGWALIFGGGTVSNCLGPLGVTLVQCAAHGGRLPTQSAVVPLAAIAVALGLIVVLGLPSPRLGLLAGAAGGAAGAAVYFSTRWTVFEGLDFDGRTWLTVSIPVDTTVLVAWMAAFGLMGAALAAMVMTTWRQRRESRGSRGSV